MIVSFRDAETAELYRLKKSRRFGAVQRVALKKLVALEAAINLDDLRNPPGNRLEALRGGRAGQHSLRVNEQFRICFLWREGAAYDVEIVDYH